eukprot:TRINITY_DN74937_c0_g1_i1.p1 TRINITY_DN74937_c0_g1~~TRINITY_DN74937_c0_g1_i1.p1  ORF type:complete len:349 (-),score=61.54 TRINITY_DN74937_c0_g1_i1:139-1185(-)
MALLSNVPAQQKQIVLVEPNEDLTRAKFEVRVVDVPKPKPGEVLVKMAAAPVNPSDFGTWMRTPKDAEPSCVGNEGCGVVVASGGGMATWGKIGKKVGVVCRGTGSYQQYVAVDAKTGVFPLDQSMDVKDAASFFVNPYTAVGILDTVQRQGASAFVHTAASSQLGQMLVKLAPSQGITVVNIVRREEQAEMLRAIGAEHVVVQKAGWEKELGELIAKLKVRVAFECIAGDTTGTIMSLMPKKSITFVYGALSEKPVGNINPMDLIYQQKKIVGWLLPNWLQEGGVVKTLFRLRKAASLVNPALKPGGWASSQFEDVSMESWFQKFLSMRKQSGNGGFTGRKLRIIMD